MVEEQSGERRETAGDEPAEPARRADGDHDRDGRDDDGGGVVDEDCAASDESRCRRAARRRAAREEKRTQAEPARGNVREHRRRKS